MIKVRGIVIIIAAVAVAALAGNLLTRQSKGPSGRHVKLVVAARDIPAGTRIEAHHMQLQQWPESARPKDTFDGLKDLEGRVANEYIYTGEPITGSRLSAPGTPTTPEPIEWLGPSDTGMRIASLEVDPVSGLAGMLKPGDLVDVIAKDSLSQGNTRQVARCILSSVTVMDVGTPQSTGKSSRASKIIVTFNLNPEQARILALFRSSPLTLSRLTPTGGRPAPELDAVVFSLENGPDTRSGIAQKDQERIQGWDLRMDKGRRAMTLSFKDDDGICGFLRPGNRVDVMGISFAGNISSQGDQPGAKATLLNTSKTARIILQNLEILEVQSLTGTPESDMPGSSDKKAAMGTGNAGGSKISRQAGSKKGSVIGQVTFLVSPDVAEKLVTIYNSQYIKLIVRNSKDQGIVHTRGEKLTDMFWKDKQYYTVEYYYGSKEWGMTFDQEDFLPEKPEPNHLLPHQKTGSAPSKTYRTQEN